MKANDELLITGETFVHKFVLPFLILGGVLVLGVVSAFNTELPNGVFILFVTCGWSFGSLIWLIPYVFPLKQVWLGTYHFRISNFRTELVLPYSVVENIGYGLTRPPIYVVVRLREETIFGSRFTFISRARRSWSFLPAVPDEVIEFRKRVKAAHDPKSRPLVHPLGRSIMADDELDSPS